MGSSQRQARWGDGLLSGDHGRATALVSLRLGFAIGAGRLARLAARALRRGSGSVLPGEVALRLEPRALARLAAQLPRGVILIAGTNGKTTTALLLSRILENAGWQVAHNRSGANLQNGLTTALLDRADLLGRVRADCAILEVDENVLPVIVGALRPRLILGLNLFRDQLDRYGEVDLISARWAGAIKELPAETTVILNADDPTLSHLGQQLTQPALYFGLNEPEAYAAKIPHAVDSVYCPCCGQRLDYRGVYYSHLGDYACPACGFARSARSIDSRAWPQVLIGLYNKYNTLAAVLAAQQLGISEDVIRTTVANFHAAFGRAEELEVQGRRVRILLTKNPAGMNETIRAVQDPTYRAGCGHATLVALNDRIPDGTDVSWIWDVDMEALVQPGQTLIAGGDRAYDLALRLEYGRAARSDALGAIVVEPDLDRAISIALEQTQPGEVLHILPTYSAMLEVRQILTGRQIL